MTLFIVFCIVMAIVAIGLVVRPLLQSSPSPGSKESGAPPSRVAAALMAVIIPAVAGSLYVTVSNWQWNQNPLSSGPAAIPPEIETMVAQLEQRLAEEPADVEGWLMLGRASVMVQRYPRAVEAFERAYELTEGENISATTGLAEALVLVDEATLDGRAGELIEEALLKAPDEPRALWYGSLAALSGGRLAVARDRMQRLLAQNPPEQVRDVLQSQIAALNAELGDAAVPPAGAGGPSVRVAVSLAPEVAARISEPRTVFVIARDAAGGPPLAAVRLSTDELPRTVELADGNAMIAGRGISSVTRAEIVARVSATGEPLERSGDFFGEVDYAVQPGQGSVTVVIDREVP